MISFFLLHIQTNYGIASFAVFTSAVAITVPNTPCNSYMVTRTALQA